MIHTKKRTSSQEISLGGRSRVSPGIFIWIVFGLIFTGTILPLGAQTVSPAGTTSPVRLLSSDMLVSPLATFRAAEGELQIYIGDSSHALTPFSFSTPSEGVIHCSTETKKFRYQFSFRQQLCKASDVSCKVGILDVTVVNEGNAKGTTEFWVAWRHAYLQPHLPCISLGIENRFPAEPSVNPIGWNPAFSWQFIENMFLRDERIVYRVVDAKGWQRDNWVRLSKLPYRDITEQSVLGYTQFQRELEPKGNAGIRILVPHQSLPYNQKDIFSTF